MPYRILPFIKDETYHTYNRSVAKVTIFPHDADYRHFLEILHYYRHFNPPVRFSIFNRLPIEANKHVIEQLKTSPVIVDVYAYCLMPTHFHLLMKEIVQGGISIYLRRIQNSYAKYFNTKYKRGGALFQSMFKCARIAYEEQLIHTLRYIHLNPFTGGIVHNPNDILTYPWSSAHIYNTHPVCADKFVNTQPVSAQFQSLEELRLFTLNQADYQRNLEIIRHTIEDAP